MAEFLSSLKITESQEEIFNFLPLAAQELAKNGTKSISCRKFPM